MAYSLSFNPSYQTREVTFESCPSYDLVNSRTSDTEYTRNVPRIRGDSILGIYGGPYQRFEGIGNGRCFQCNTCEQNSMTPLFYRPPRQIEHLSYGVTYRGKDNYYRKPY